jgi:protein TonB
MKNLTFIRFSILLLGVFFATSSFIQSDVPIAEHYTGGEEQLLKDIAVELQYPPMAKRNRKQGTCIVHVKLMEDGSFGYVKIVKNIGAGCGDEAVRIVKTLKFKAPGYVAEYNIPVKFKL